MSDFYSSIWAFKYSILVESRWDESVKSSFDLSRACIVLDILSSWWKNSKLNSDLSGGENTFEYFEGICAEGSR